MGSGIDAARLRRAMQEMDPYRFEHLVADVWEFQGYETRVSQESNDRGVDVVAYKETPYPEKVVIQAKRYGDSNTVGSPEVQQYASLLPQEDADAVAIVTSGAFTQQARDISEQLNVKLIDGADLCELIARHGIGQSVARSYFEDVDLTAGDAASARSGGDSTAKPGLALLSGVVGLVYTVAALAAVADAYGTALPQPVWGWANDASFAGYAGALGVLGGGVLVTLFMLLSSQWVWKLAGVCVVVLAASLLFVSGRAVELLGATVLLSPILGSFGVFYTDLRRRTFALGSRYAGTSRPPRFVGSSLSPPRRPTGPSGGVRSTRRGRRPRLRRASSVRGVGPVGRTLRGRPDRTVLGGDEPPRRSVRLRAERGFVREGFGGAYPPSLDDSPVAHLDGVAADADLPEHRAGSGAPEPNRDARRAVLGRSARLRPPRVYRSSPRFSRSTYAGLSARGVPTATERSRRVRPEGGHCRRDKGVRVSLSAPPKNLSQRETGPTVASGDGRASRRPIRRRISRSVRPPRPRPRGSRCPSPRRRAGVRGRAWPCPRASDRWPPRRRGAGGVCSRCCRIRGWGR